MENRDEAERIIEAYLSIFGNKWNLLIMNELFECPKRFNELKRSLTPITQTVLIRHLKSLEEWDVIERVEVNGTQQSVYYAISKNGYSVIPSMISTYGWIKGHVPGIRSDDR